MSRNDITGDEIKSKSISNTGRDNWDNIFKKQTFDQWLQERYNGAVYRIDNDDLNSSKLIGVYEFEKLLDTIEVRHHYIEKE
jgi:hypothetical protein